MGERALRPAGVHPATGVAGRRLPTTEVELGHDGTLVSFCIVNPTSGQRKQEILHAAR